MKMTTYRPFGLNRTFDRFFDDFFGQAMGNDHLQSQPALNVRATDDAYHLELAAPGLAKEDFEIHVDGDRLTLSAEWKKDAAPEATGYTRREFNFRSFSRTLQLPDDVETEAITARYDAGILHLGLPKKAAVLPQPAQRIEIK